MIANDGVTFPPRKWYRRVPFISTKPIERRLTAPTKKSIETPSTVEDGTECDDKIALPESKANWLSILTFGWLGELLSTGYTRPLQAGDLYDMPGDRLAKDHAESLEKNWSARLDKNSRKATSSWKPFWARRTTDTTVLTLALSDVCFRWFWLGGFFKLSGDLSQILSPLLIRFLIRTLSDPSAQAHRSGFGYSVGLFLLLVFSVTCNVHGFYRSYTTGILLRGALMHSIYRRVTTKLTERAKLKHGLGTGKLMSLMSADVTRVDFACGFFHAAWTSILQILLCFALTAWSIGYSALPGFGLLALLYPLQIYMTRQLLKLRRGSMPFTDARVKAVVEAVATIRLVKTNGYEKSLLSRIEKLRSDEVVYIRKRMLLRALNISVSYTAPTLAAVVSIVCYGATSPNGMEANVVFSALAFFLLLRTPLQALPTALSAIADARAALERLAAFMVAGHSCPTARPVQNSGSGNREYGSDVVVKVEDAVFAYHDDEEFIAFAETAEEKGEQPAVSGIHMQTLHIDSLEVQQNQLVCITGPVAAGKSSVFAALMNDMQLIRAASCWLNIDSTLSSSQLAFAPQTAWLLSETVRENIVFGRPLDLLWYNEVLSRCCLHEDLRKLPDGDMTVVGEMGVSLSGGQKQRIGLARAIYGKSKLLFLDDCFSALDARVGARVFDMVVNKARKERETTIVMVTQSMSFARQADNIVYMEGGRIVEQGPYKQLTAQNGPFTEFVGTSLVKDADAESPQDLNSPQQDGDTGNTGNQEGEEKAVAENSNDGQVSNEKQKQQTRGKEIMQKEERIVGTVSGNTYGRYVLMGNAWLTVPLFVTSILIYQGTSVVSPLWLSWWQDTKYESISEASYMGGYAAFGVGQSLGLFFMSASFAVFCFFCSNNLHRAAISKVLHAPLAFFDTTPQGRITHRFSKDVDAVDNVVGETLRLFISTASQVVGTIIVVTIVLPPFIAVAALLLLVYTWTGMYYRPSSRELRRLNNLLRSRIYEHFGESMSGLPTLKAFGAVSRFVEDNASKIDTENTAYWLSIACQRWLNLRLDLCGAVLVLAAGLLVVGLRDSIDPSAGGVVLSYVVTAQAVFGNMIRQSAEIENNMNSVERMLHYAYNLEQEPLHEVDGADTELREKDWPSNGRVQFESVTLSHREGLEPALRDVTLDIKPGEKVGVVGRTGAGKSTCTCDAVNFPYFFTTQSEIVWICLFSVLTYFISVVSAFLRITEPTSGRILIDGVNIHKIGLHLLRSSLSVISQDAILLAGSIRYNLDPFHEFDDDWLNQCLQRVGVAKYGSSFEKAQSSVFAQVAESDSSEDEKAKAGGQNGPSLNLDSQVKENGSNISQGQRSLISIARALVRRSRIVILDEATASIDGKADAELQAMLTNVLKDATVITVAHRLDTIMATCDRVVAMDSGEVVEFDTIPALLSRPEGLFRALCDAANVTIPSQIQ
jgi:ABC-type multidrug transport system fused ATPase/permease subunit